MHAWNVLIGWMNKITLYLMFNDLNLSIPILGGTFTKNSRSTSAQRVTLIVTLLVQ